MAMENSSERSSVQLSRIRYVSRAAPCIQMSDVDAIVSRARAINSYSGVTGQLLFTGAYFFQVIEGPFDHLKNRLSSIRLDVRHHDLRTIEEIDIERRRFERWPMQYVQDFGLQDLVEELWWSQKVDLARAAQLVQYLTHELHVLPRPGRGT